MFPVHNVYKPSDCSYSYYRNNSSNFGLKVKKHLMSKCKQLCATCGESSNLTIDHIISVYLGFKYDIPLRHINNSMNFQILCNSCNCRKSPNHLESHVKRSVSRRNEGDFLSLLYSMSRQDLQ